MAAGALAVASADTPCGSGEVGGSCVELEAGESRLVLDLGLPLNAGDGERVALPPIAGLEDGDDPTLLGVVLSHSHLDHWGLLPQAHSDVPLYCGEATAGMLAEAAFFSPRGGASFEPRGELLDRQPFRVGPFTVTPFLVDHSAFDAYALLVEADGRRLLYSGDLRAHGRKPALFERLVASPPSGVNALVLEGTTTSGPTRASGPQRQSRSSSSLAASRSHAEVTSAVTRSSTDSSPRANEAASNRRRLATFDPQPPRRLPSFRGSRTARSQGGLVR